MTDEPTGRKSGLDGVPIDEAVDVVCAHEDVEESEQVRAVLSEASDGEVVSREALDDRIAHTSKVVATPETRVELAAMALEDTRNVAEPVADLDVVGNRIDAFGERLAGVERRLDSVQTDLQGVVDDEIENIYETARRVRKLQRTANDVTEAADALKLDIEEFEHWLTSPDKRLRDLETDVDDFERSLDAFEDRIGSLSSSTAGERSDESVREDDPGDGSDDRGDEQAAAVEWARTSIRRRVLELVSTDLKWELDALERWHEREGIERHERTADLESRLEGIESRLDEFETRLERLSTRAWRERHGEKLQAVEETLAEMDPPVDWGAVESDIEDHRVAIESA